MTTIQGFAVRPRRSLAALATALAAAGIAVGSGADFTSRSANPANTFTAGKLTSDNSRDGAAIFSASDMKPGGAPQTGTVDIANSGDIGAAFTLTRDQLDSTDTGTSNPAAFAAKVDVVVTDCGAFAGGGGQAPACGDTGDRVVYDGTLAAMNAPAALGDFGAGERHRYSFAATLDSSAGNEYQGDGSSARFVWDAVQK
jgi:spore coat-associated protein N